METIDGDPLNQTRRANQGKNITDAEREEKMVEVVNMFQHDAVGCFGAYHLPALADGLKDKYHVLGLNTTNSEFRVKDDRQQRLESEFPSIVLEGKEVNEAKLFEFFLTASLKHDLTRAGVREQNQEYIKRAARRAIYAEAPGLMGPMPPGNERGGRRG